jgi:hypothetical protein
MGVTSIYREEGGQNICERNQQLQIRIDQKRSESIQQLRVD